MHSLAIFDSPIKLFPGRFRADCWRSSLIIEKKPRSMDEKLVFDAGAIFVAESY
jgi:hypothetical protein